MSLQTQPIELLTLQMNLLDLESLESLCEVDERAKEICEGKWFWIEKLKREVEGLSEEKMETWKSTKIEYVGIQEIKGGAKKLYCGLIDPIYAVKMEVMQMIEFHRILGGVEVNREMFKAAVRFSSENALRWLIMNDTHYLEEEVFPYAAQEGDIKSLQAFMRYGFGVKKEVLILAVINCKSDNFKYLISQVGMEEDYEGIFHANYRNEDSKLYFPLFDGFDYMNDYSILEEIRGDEEKVRRFQELVKWLIGEKLLDVSRDAGNIAVILGDVEGLKSFEGDISVTATEYAFEYGSDEMVKEVIKKGGELLYIHGFTPERLAHLVSLGVKCSDEILTYNIGNPKRFFAIVDSGLVDFRTAMEMAIQESEEQSDEEGENIQDAFLTGVLERKGYLAISRMG